jgi:hypothetical protein
VPELLEEESITRLKLVFNFVLASRVHIPVEESVGNFLTKGGGR